MNHQIVTPSIDCNNTNRANSRKGSNMGQSKLRKRLDVAQVDKMFVGQTLPFLATNQNWIYKERRKTLFSLNRYSLLLVKSIMLVMVLLMMMITRFCRSDSQHTFLDLFKWFLIDWKENKHYFYLLNYYFYFFIFLLLLLVSYICSVKPRGFTRCPIGTVIFFRDSKVK